MPTDKPSMRDDVGMDVPSSRGPAGPLSMKPSAFGPYVLESRIAVGGTAEVYLARPGPTCTGMPARVVLKRLLPHFVQDPESRTMFDREARLHAIVQDDNVVTVFGSGVSDEGEPYLVMEYIDGLDCYRLLRSLNQGGKAMPVDLAIFVAREVLKALASVHEAKDATGRAMDIIHRDVTPSNIYLSREGRIKLGDFGIARSTTRKTMKTTDGTVLKGKFAYLSPEQVASEPFDHRADLFSLAAVLVEMILGKPLFSGSGQLSVLLAIRDCRLDPIVEAKDRLPQGLFEVLLQALDREPSKRFQSARAFADALEPLQKEPLAAHRELAELVTWAQSCPAPLSGRAGRDPTKRPTPSSPASAQGPRQEAASSGVTPAIQSLRPPAEVQIAMGDSEPSALAAPPAPRTAGDAQGQEKRTSEYGLEPSYVKTASGETFGPWTYAQLVEHIATGVLGRDDLVNFLGRGFEPLDQIEDLLRFLPAKTATSHHIPGLGSPDITDDLAEGSMLDILVRLYLQSETGVLFVESMGDGTEDSGRKDVYFVDGKLHHVATSDANELLGRYLVRRGMISKDELDFTLAVLPRFAGRIGEALISLGLVTGVDVFKAIREQGRDRVVATFPWRRGRYFFYRGQTAPHVEFPLDLDIPSLLLAGTESEGDGRVQTKESVTDGPLHLTFGKECTVHGLPWPPVLALAFKAAETVRTKRAFLDALMTRGPADEALAKRALAVVEAAFRVTRA